MKTAFVYPGQGAQATGMGVEFFDSELAKQADDICGFELCKLMRDGPDELLQSTTYCQPALFLHSALVFEAFKNTGTPSIADFHLGLSLGEFSALYGCGAMSFEDVMKALVIRGKAMQDACKSNPGGMMSVLGLEDDVIEKVCDQAREDGVLEGANYNAPGQVVVSGDAAALERAIPLLKDAGARRVLPLKVAGAFHSPLMAPAAEKLKEFLNTCDIGQEASKVISNVSAAAHDQEQVTETLVKQLTSPVRWSKSISNLIENEGISHFLEMGTGKILSGLIKRVSKEVKIQSISNPDELDVYNSSLAEL